MGPAEGSTAEEVFEKIRAHLKTRFARNQVKLSRIQQRLLPPAMSALGDSNPTDVLEADERSLVMCNHDLGSVFHKKCLKICECLALRGYETSENPYEFEYTTKKGTFKHKMSLWFTPHATLYINDYFLNEAGEKEKDEDACEIVLRLFKDTTWVAIKDWKKLTLLQLKEAEQALSANKAKEDH
jgi:hypothetical protein